MVWNKGLYTARIFYKCLNCGKEAFTLKSQARAYKGTGKFCTKSCKGEYYRKNFRNHPSYKNAETKTSQGYVIKTFSSNTRLAVHRIIAENKIGRPLKRSEVAHHINGIKTDNRIENITVLSRREHSKLHREKQLEAKHEELTDRLKQLS